MVLVTTSLTKCVCQGNSMGGACSTCGGRKMRVGGGSLNKIDDLEDLGVDGSVIFRFSIKMGAHGQDSSGLYCIVVGSRQLMPPDALQPKAYCTNSGL